MDLKKRAAALKTDIPAVFLALKAKETPLIAKIVAGITVAYALSPIDLIPDFIPILGYLDDVILLPTLVSLTLKLIPPDVFANYREQAKGMWEAKEMVLRHPHYSCMGTDSFSRCKSDSLLTWVSLRAEAL